MNNKIKIMCMCVGLVLMLGCLDESTLYAAGVKKIIGIQVACTVDIPECIGQTGGGSMRYLPPHLPKNPFIYLISYDIEERKSGGVELNNENQLMCLDGGGTCVFVDMSIVDRNMKMLYLGDIEEVIK